jgi:prepilin-type N-terminal cleavage/methylation domain-containing protein
MTDVEIQMTKEARNPKPEAALCRIVPRLPLNVSTTAPSARSSAFRLPPSPHGVTLIEVLISMFVLLIGLLGVGTICQLGRLTLTETAKYDRAAACGRAGLREMRIRRMLDVANWYDYRATTPLLQIAPASSWAYGSGTGTAGPPSFDPMDSYCIDPLLISALVGNSSIDRFPSVVNSAPSARSMKRVTLGTVTNGAFSLPMPPNTTVVAPVASRIFFWRDDLAFDTTYVPKLRPQRIYRNAGGVAQAGFESVPAPPYLLAPRNTSVYAETDVSQQAVGGIGGYSWMVTVTPAYQEMALISPASSNPPLSWSDRHLYNVSVVVFYKRDLSLPVQQTAALGADQSESSERIVTVTFRNPTGYSGGDVTLTAPNAASAPGDFFNIKRDDWLLLCGQSNAYHSADYSAANTKAVNLFRWYRIVAIDDSTLSITNSPRTRNVTLAGPDWPILPSGTYIGNMNNTTYTGVLVNNVVGVYSEVMTLESNRLWAPAP